MDTNYVLTWMVAISAAGTALRTFQLQGRHGWDWIVAALAVLGALGVGHLLAPGFQGWIGLGFWGLFMGLPILASRNAVRRMVAQDYRSARRWAQFVVLLHPVGDWRRGPRLMSALELVSADRLAEARAIFETLGQVESALGRIAIARWYQAIADWDALVAWVKSIDPQILAGEPGLLATYARALGERRDAEASIELYRAHESSRVMQESLQNRAVFQLFVVAFAGRRDLVERLLAGPLRSYPIDVATIWRAVAMESAGDPVGAEGMLSRLDRTDLPLTRRALAQRRANPLSRPVLSSEALQTVEGIARELTEAETSTSIASPPARPAPATWVVLLLLSAMFALELVGGSTDLDNLYSLGALVLPMEEVEPWRFLTAGLLHYGALHWLLNSLGLYVIGRFVEKVLGTARFVAVYFVTGPCALGLVAWVAAQTQAQPSVLVGASGSVMGLVGAALAIHWVAWRRQQTRVARARLLSLLAIVALQTVFDLSTPQVSFLAHLGGAVSGFLLALLLARRLERYNRGPHVRARGMEKP